MAVFLTDRSFNGKRYITATHDQAVKAKEQLLDVPNDLSEPRYDFLRSITAIRFGDGSLFPKPDPRPSHLTHEGIYQGKAAAYGGDN